MSASGSGTNDGRIGRIVERLTRLGEVMDPLSLARLRLKLLGLNAAEADELLEQLEREHQRER